MLSGTLVFLISQLRGLKQDRFYLKAIIWHSRGSISPYSRTLDPTPTFCYETKSGHKITIINSYFDKVFKTPKVTLTFSTNCVLASIIKSLTALFTRTSVNWNYKLKCKITKTLLVPLVNQDDILIIKQTFCHNFYCTLASWTSELTWPWISCVREIILWEKSCRYLSIWK